MKCPICGGELQLERFGGHPKGVVYSYYCRYCALKNRVVRLEVLDKLE
jgi:transposase-like protein